MSLAPARADGEHSRRKRLFSKLCLIVGGVAVAMLALAGYVLMAHVERSEYAEASGNLLDKSRTIRNMLRSTHQLMIVAVDRLYEVLHHDLRGEWGLATRERVQLGGHEVAPLTLAGRTVLPDFKQIDNFTRASGGHAATIFVRHGDDFLRLATSLPDGGGSRAVGTALEREHPGYGKLMRGESYVGYVRLFERPYMARYEPLVDRSGRVIGALFVGLDLSDSIAQVRREIAAMRVGRTGYVFVIDSMPGPSYGRLLVHPRYEGMDGSQVVSEQALGFFRAALKNPDGHVGTYEFSDVEGAPLRAKIAALADFPEWNWIIGAGAYLDEFSAQRHHLQIAIFGGMFLAGFTIVVVMSLALSRYVLSPMFALEARLRGSEERFRSVVNSSSDIIFTIAADARYDGFFARGSELHGLPVEDQLGRLPSELLGERGLIHDLCHFRALSGEDVVYETTAELPAARIEYQIALSPIRDAGGAVCGAVGIARDITQRKLAEAQARHAAQHDPLTGLPNRALLDDRLRQAISRAKRNGTQVGIYYIDLDHFKEVNDRLGHAVGDQLLCVAAQRFQRCVRQCDTVARLGGDEFVIVLDAPDETALLSVADKLIGSFGEPFELAGKSLKISLSIGMCRYPAHGLDPVKLLQYADLALYQAKNAGRNTYRCATGTDSPAAGQS